MSKALYYNGNVYSFLVLQLHSPFLHPLHTKALFEWLPFHHILMSLTSITLQHFHCARLHASRAANSRIHFNPIKWLPLNSVYAI